MIVYDRRRGAPAQALNGVNEQIAAATASDAAAAEDATTHSTAHAMRTGILTGLAIWVITRSLDRWLAD